MIMATKIDYMWKRVFNETPVGEWLDCQYYDDESGESFFVELKREAGATIEEFIQQCDAIAKENFEAPILCGIVTQEEAEMIGYDTY